jgi:hypothetical protein
MKRQSGMEQTMRINVVIIVSLLVCVLASQLVAFQNQPRVLVLSPQPVWDEKTRLEAGRVLAPQGWQVHSRTLWHPQSATFFHNLSEVVDPRTGVGVRFLPLEQFSVNATLFHNARQQGVPAVTGGMELLDRPLNAAEYIQYITMPRYRNLPNARFVGGRELPQAAQALMQTNAVLVMAAQAGYQGNVQVYAARFEYTLQNGATMEEDIICALAVTWNPREVEQARAVGLPPAALLIPIEVVSYSAPKGQLDGYLPILRAVAASYRMSPKFGILYYSIAQMRQRAAIDDHIIARLTNEQITESQSRTFREQQYAEEMRNMNFRDLLGGTQRFDDPHVANRQIILPAGFGHAWTDGQDRYIITDDPNFKPVDHPNVFTGNWTNMPPSR